jgi:hypothetical protein
MGNTRARGIALMREKPERPFVGPTAFLATLAAVLVFFWWLLIYDHGIPPGQ